MEPILDLTKKYTLKPVKKKPSKTAILKFEKTQPEQNYSVTFVPKVGTKNKCTRIKATTLTIRLPFFLDFCSFEKNSFFSRDIFFETHVSPVNCSFEFLWCSNNEKCLHNFEKFLQPSKAEPQEKKLSDFFFSLQRKRFLISAAIMLSC